MPRRTLTRAELVQLEELAAKGCAERTICAALRLGHKTWEKAKKEEPVADALARGRAREHDALVGSLYTAATEKGNIVAAIFLLKARHSYKDTGDQPVDQRVQIAVTLPAALGPDQYQKLLATAKAIPVEVKRVE